MVNKITLIAVVLLVACPILIGYAMAFDDVEHDVWDESNTRGITGLLYNSEGWSYTTLNSYMLNGQIMMDSQGNLTYPYYEYYSSTVTSLPIQSSNISSGTNYSVPNNGHSSSIFFASLGTSLTLRQNNVDYVTISDVVTAGSTSAIGDTSATVYGTYLSGGNTLSFSYDTINSFRLDKNGKLVEYNPAPYPNMIYADPVYGWRFASYESVQNNLDMYWSVTDLKASMITITIDFGSLMKYMSENTTNTLVYQVMADSAVRSISVVINKAGNSSTMTIDGQNVPVSLSGGTLSADNNVWQLTMDEDSYIWDYVKSWPGQFGRAQPYFTLDTAYNTTVQYLTAVRLPEVNVRIASSDVYGYAPTYRADYCAARSNVFPVMENITYDPASQLLMDSTASYRIELADIGQIGDSITWGGETYPVTNGSITVNNIKIKVSNLQLDSRYLDGVRTNYINGREISTGSNALGLSGTWGAIVSLSELDHSTVTSTEWIPGQFAWNGVDSSFALMGLITCVGVFIGLGMYGRRSGAKVGTLMLICGGAALIFLALI